jgi:hypothetical protein
MDLKRYEEATAIYEKMLKIRKLPWAARKGRTPQRRRPRWWLLHHPLAVIQVAIKK